MKNKNLANMPKKLSATNTPNAANTSATNTAQSPTTSTKNAPDSITESKVNIMLYAVMLACFLVFCFMGYRYLEVEFLNATSGDEMPQFLQLQKMYEGLISLNIKTFFAFEFYNYGFIYYALNLLVSLPFIIAENYALQIYAPRVLNGIFSVLNLLMLFKILRLFLSPLNSLGFVALFVAMSGFWHFGYSFKPDVFQAFFVLLSAYYLLRDNYAFGRFYTLGWVSLGLGIGVAKFAAILFIPMIYAYIFLPFCFREKSFRFCILAGLRAGAGMILLWIFSNPYLLHPRGFLAWLSMFRGNMLSNATNHGAYNEVSLGEKLWGVIDFYYTEMMIFALLIILCGVILFITIKAIIASFKSDSSTIGADKRDFQNLDSIPLKNADIKRVFIMFSPIVLGFLISLIYLIFFVNKAWGSYYFSSMLLGVVVLGLCVRAIENIENLIENLSAKKATQKAIAFAGGGGDMYIAFSADSRQCF